MASRPKPTNAELAILRVLWRCGPSTVRDVHSALADGDGGGRSNATTAPRGVGYTTVLKLLQIMVEKGLVRRDVSSRSHVYAPQVTETATQRRLVADLLERAFGGSALGLVQQALSAKRPSREEVRAIRRLLDEQNGGDS